MKKRTTHRYSILIVPENDSNIRRFEFSKRLLLACLSSFALACVAICICVVSLMHYYRAYSSTEEARIRAAQFERERSTLITRVSALEDGLLRTQRFAAKLGALADDKNEVKGGLGPFALSEDDDKGFDKLWKPPSEKFTSEKLLTNLDLMKDSAVELEELLHSVFARQQDEMYFWSSLPTVWPTRGFLTSQFGAGRGHRRHEGIDIAGRVGTPIVAPGDGIVTFAGYKGGYGNTLKVDHGYGLTTVYGHCSKVFASEGDKVKRGEVIAAVGNTGSSTGPHLHFEVRVDGMPVNPIRYLAKR